MGDDIDYKAIGSELDRLIGQRAREESELEELMLRIDQLPKEQAHAVSGSGSEARERRGRKAAKSLEEQMRELNEQALRKRESIGRLVNKIYELREKLKG